MKQQWQQLVLRIDAMQLRERAFLFLAILICCLALADTLWLSPAQLQFAAQGIELQRLRDELKTVAQPVDASKALRDDIAAANLRLDAINQEITAVAPLAEGGPAIEQALVQFLRRQEGLTLLSTATLPQDAAGPGTAAPANAATPAVLSRRGLELRVSGSYADLVRYVKTLETHCPHCVGASFSLKPPNQHPS
jgi:MSHA biogenesis protein MshJ